jgi:hypothetical protein
MTKLTAPNPNRPLDIGSHINASFSGGAEQREVPAAAS